MQQPGPSPRRDWVIIGGLITVVAVSWVGFFVFWMLRKPAAPKPAAPPRQAGPVGIGMGQTVSVALPLNRSNQPPPPGFRSGPGALRTNAISPTNKPGPAKR